LKSRIPQFLQVFNPPLGRNRERLYGLSNQPGVPDRF
jgi:hypothetical protein